MITLSTLPVPEIDLSLTLKIIEKLYWCFKNDTDIEAQRARVRQHHWHELYRATHMQRTRTAQ